MNWLDAAISFVSPEWGARRVAWRNELRNYDAGNDARLNAGWRVANYSAEATDRGNREYVRARARDLERNSDVMNSVLGAYKRNVVGTGFQLRSMTKKNVVNKELERLWKIWCKARNCDVTGQQSLNQILRMAVVRKKVDGGILFVKRYTRDGILPFSLQMLEVDELDSMHVMPEKNGNRVVGGIEYSKGRDNDAKKESNNTSLFLQGDWELVPHVTLSGGVRHDRPESFESHNSFSYKLGWDITEKDTIYAGRSDYYILPSLSQLYDNKYGNANLRASEGRTTSIGYNHEFTPENYLMWSWFETKSRVGMSINSPMDQDDPTYGQYINSEGGISRGWNLQYDARLCDTVSIKLGWSHLFYDDKDNFTMGYAPKDKATFGVYYDKDKFSAAFDGFYFIRDKRGVKDGVKGWPCDKYGVYNLALNYTADKQTKFYLKVDNIFNKLWAEHTDVIWGGGAHSWYAMPGRSFMIGMQYTF